MTPQRFQLSRRKGWRMPPNSAKVDRTTPFGNFPAAAVGLSKGKKAVQCHREYLRHPASAPLRKAATERLTGKNLGCWCGLDEPCHADNWLAFLYGEQTDRKEG